MTPTSPESAWTTPALHHDLRHQLATVRLLLAAAAGSGAEQAQDVAQLLASAAAELDQAVALTDALTAAPEAWAPRCRLDAVVRAAGLTAVGPVARLAVEAEAELWAPLDATSASRVVRNLLDNALAAAGARGGVLVRAGQHPGGGGPWVRLEVHDDGPGPGPRGFARGGGTGLDVVRALVLPSGGWLSLGTSPLGGALAAVTLPAVPPVPPVPPVPRQD